VEDRLVEVLVALENDRELVVSTTASIGSLIVVRLQLGITRYREKIGKSN
jgi:hypothetical protein